MNKEERKALMDKVRNVFNFSYYYRDTETDEKTIKTCRSFVMSFLYEILSSSLIEKKFYFYRTSSDNEEKVSNLNMCDLIDDVMIDLKHYLSYIEKYNDEDSVFYELDRLNDDYLDIHKIPEFNSKKYIAQKINHIGEILPILGKKINQELPSKLEVSFNESESWYGNEWMVFGNKMGSHYPLDDFWEYITPIATDEAILAKIEKKMFDEKIEKVRIAVLNSVEELELYLKLDCLDMFLSSEEIKKLKEFQKFFEDFNDKQCELFGKEELGYGETRRYKRY